ncbi:MAG: hypothetical protein ACP5P3_09245 [Ignavibacteria bacterium]
MQKRFLLILISLLNLSGVSFSQYIFQPESYKLSETYLLGNPVKTQLSQFKASIIANPINSKYPISNFITDIFPSGDTVWFATGSGIMRTINNFASFQHYYGISPFGEDDISGFVVKNNFIVVATAISQEISGENIPVGTGIKVSIDYGLTWNSFPQPVDNTADSNIVYGSNTLYALPVVVPQQNLAYDIAVTRTKNTTNGVTIWITSFAGGLRKSTDLGTTWQRVVLPPDNLDSININVTGYTFSLNPRNNLNHRAFTVEALNDSSLIVGTANGVNISTDWGVSWRKFNFQNSGSGINRIAGNFVVNLHIQRFSNQAIIWAATRKAEDPNEVNAISYTTNLGQSWRYTLKDISPNGISSKDSIVFAETEGGLWRARFGIFDWSKPSIIYDEITKDVLKTSSFYSGSNIGDTLYFGSADGLLRTIETGQPWLGRWKIFRAMQVIDLNSDIKTYAAPNPFSPSTEVTRIFYKTGKTISKITIKIFDFGMNPVKTLIQNAVRTNPDELFTMWDGKNNSGYQVANGVYFYRIEVDDDPPVWGKILVLQ